MDDFDPCRAILKEIHANRTPISGGTGTRPRYEMRKTNLYFRLGVALVEMSRDQDELATESKLESEIIKLQSEFNDSENVFRWSIRFVRAFANEVYFEEVSRICHYSFGQLREAVDILDKNNSLHISDSDRQQFISKMKGPITYEEVRKLCMDLKSKYLGAVPDVDFASLSDLFDSVEHQITYLIEGNETARQIWREKTGLQSITALRYVLMLLAREQTYLEVKEKKSKILNSLGPKIASPNPEILQLYATLFGFLQSGPHARDQIRSLFSSVRLGYLQTMLKALISENDYRAFSATKDLMSKINI